MAKITILEDQCTAFFKTINTYIDTDLRGHIDSFNKNLDVLNDGVTWRGSDAVENVGKLIVCYNEFLDCYNRIINYFMEYVPQVFIHYSSIVEYNGGQPLIVNGVSLSEFKKKTPNDLSLDGEEGRPAKLIEIAKALSTSTSGFQDTLAKLKKEMNRIGDNTDFFDTSAAEEQGGKNYAEDIKNSVQFFISNVDSKFADTLVKCITNIETAAKNLSS